MPTQTTTVWRDEIEYLTRHGYCVVVVDARGTGASNGSRQMEFSDEEAQDGYEIIDWITEQVWSNGEVAINGVSYVGTIGLLTAAKAHPAVKAVVARSAIYDLYEDVAFPGGIHQEKFVNDWAEATVQLDRNNLSVFGKRAQRLVKSVKPVSGEQSELQAAIDQHSDNTSLGDFVTEITCKDDTIEALHGTIDYYSVKGHIPELQAANTPSLIISGWYDAAMTHSALKLYTALKPNAWLLMGDWNHGRRQNMNPHVSTNTSDFPEYEYIRHFLDMFLKPSVVKVGVPKVQYYAVGDERWQTAVDWPLPNMQYNTFYLDGDARLAPSSKGIAEGADTYKVDVKVGSGDTSRWDIAFGPQDTRPRGYQNRAPICPMMMCYDTAPLEQPLQITGNPYLDLHLSIDAEDGPLFAYLDDVCPDGSVTYITEGMFRLAHRLETGEPIDGQLPERTYNSEDLQPLTPGAVTRIRINLLPISYKLQAGHRLRISFAAADTDHFVQFLPTPSKVNFHRGEGQHSRVFLPVVG